MPLLRKESLAELIAIHHRGDSPVTMTSFLGEPGSAFGRVIRNQDGKVAAIVEKRMPLRNR